jgi:hypothetical protein
MMFSEIYSAYFNTVAAIIEEAIDGTISYKRVDEIIRERAFGESVLSIIPALKNDEWAIIGKDLKTPVKNKPSMPLTILQKRFIKAISLDPRMRLFDVNESDFADIDGFDKIEPLFYPSDFVYFDKYGDGDPFCDEEYINRFKTILTAIRERKRIFVVYRNRKSRLTKGNFIPYKLEYSDKDDKFRLETAGGRFSSYINLQRIISVTLGENFSENEVRVTKQKEATVRFILKNERNALERVMLHFSDCKKETRRLENGMFDINLRYEILDETEILIRILSFGPMIKVTSPQSFIDLIKKRLNMQKKLFEEIADSLKK